MSSFDPVRTILIGLGRMGRFHLEALAAVSEASVVAMVEPSTPALAAASSRRPDATTYAAVADALEHPAAEACVIASPTPTHPAAVAAALDAGLHVLCEKPLALDPGEARALGQRAAERGLVLQVGFWRRFAAPWRAAKEVIDAGGIGTPVLLRLAQWDAEAPPAAFCDPAVSGGLAIDCGVHEYDLAEWLTGRPIMCVAAWSPPVVDDAVRSVGDVDNLVAVLTLEDGAVATVDLSRNARYGDDVRTEVLGSAGAILIETLPHGQARLGTADGWREVPGSAADDVMAAGVAAQARAFARAVRGQDVDLPGAEASARATEIGHQVTAALRRPR